MNGSGDGQKSPSKDSKEIKGPAFYSDAANYWSSVAPTNDGMLGGLGHLSNSDVKESERFLRKFYKAPDAPGKSYALDCGCGIGRVTQNFLQNHFAKVDLVDQDEKFINQAKVNLAGNPKVGEFYCSGLQNFIPQEGKYDVIWIQWVLQHLTDPDLIAFLKKCTAALKPNGAIIIKDNCTSSGELEHDDEDSSLTRPYSTFMELFKGANLRVAQHGKQKNFPKELYPVWIFGLKPMLK